MDNTKRLRCSNFNATELEILVNLVHDHRNFIECKKTDAVCNREKDGQWEALSEKFNAVVGTVRSCKQLRMKWDSLKKTTRKQYSLKKASLYQTGGGPGCGTLTDWENKVLSIIGISATGVGCSFDSDRTESQGETEEIIAAPSASVAMDENIIFEFTIPETKIFSNQVDDEPDKENEAQWTQWNPQSLKMPIHHALCSKDLEQAGENNVRDEEEQPINSILKTSNKKQTPKKRKRTNIVPTTPSSRVTNKHELLLNRKLELAELQIQLLKKEHESREKRLNEKHALEIALLKCNCKSDKE